tara:strand:- start:177 stop:491 length:315 start_codon:yes stop_codon:yes gene_type:complete
MIKQRLYDEVAIEMDSPSLADLDDYRWSSVFMKAMKAGDILMAEGIAYTMPKEAMLDTMGVELAMSIEAGIPDDVTTPAQTILKRVYRARFTDNQKETITAQIL